MYSNNCSTNDQIKDNIILNSELGNTMDEVIL